MGKRRAIERSEEELKKEIEIGEKKVPGAGIAIEAIEDVINNRNAGNKKR